jgi:IS605 OrfB family transposase
MFRTSYHKYQVGNLRLSSERRDYPFAFCSCYSFEVKLAAKLRLNASPRQEKLLLRTLEVANECANWLSREAWARKVFGQFAMHRLLYREARERFPLSAQMVVRLLGKVADSYKRDKKTERHFDNHGAIGYDARILTFGAERVSIWAVGGRQTITYSAGSRQIEQLKHQQGESDLIYRGGKWFLAATCDVAAPPLDEVTDFLGVDLGVVQIAFDSDGRSFCGSMVNNVRYRHRKLRANLQAAQSKSAKRHLKKLSGKEFRFATDVNHQIAKELVEKAERTNRGIAVEELTGIRARIRAGRSQRAILHSWAFAQLGSFVKYKAALAGVPVLEVDPRNSSRECSRCGHTEKANRPSQAKFRCRSCHHTANADLNAALNIRSRANRQLANRIGDFYSPGASCRLSADSR